MDKQKKSEQDLIKYPLVSIGVPVFNGGIQLKERIDSLLDQSYPSIELIICDNASTDDTEDISMAAVLKDDRVRYIRNANNIGIARNFNKVFEEAHGEYFMWAAHDDIHSRDFVQNCVFKLIANPSAVLCHSKVAIHVQDIDKLIYYASLKTFQRNLDISRRYKEALYCLPAVALYGIFRKDIANEIPGFRLFPGGDLLWIQELSLNGDFIQCEEVLFHYVARQNWNSFQADLKNLSSEEKFSTNAIIRMIQTLLDRTSAIRRLDSSIMTKLNLMRIATQYSSRMAVISILFRVLSLKKDSRFFAKIKISMYWRYLHNSNLEVVNPELFKSRVINPMIGLQ
jgi:glycosyltransferase involved in cell wall biosynthesis